MGVRILHLSDIHMNYQNYDTGRMQEKFFKYIADAVNNIDSIVISGDLVYKNSDYYTAKIFCTKLKSTFAKQDFIIVPGNHDVSRLNKSRNTMICGLRSNPNTNEEICDEGISEILLKPFSNYFEFADQIMIKSTRKPVSYITTERCNFILINTAIMSFEKGEEGNLDIDIISLEQCIKHIHDDKPTIAIGHHTLDCLKSGTTSKIVNLFRDYKIRLYLCGHTHKMQIDDYLSDKWLAKQLVSGSGMQDSYSTNGFYVIDYSSTSFEIAAHIYKPKEEIWDEYLDCPGFIKGKYKFNYSVAKAISTMPVSTIPREILHAISVEACRYLALLYTYPEYGFSNMISDRLFNELIKHELILDSDSADCGFSLSSVGRKAVETMKNSDKTEYCIKQLEAFIGQGDKKGVSFHLFGQLKKAKRYDEAINVLRKHGRAWLETVGLVDCIEAINSIPHSGDHIELVYLEGLAHLFSGKYDTARSTFSKHIERFSKQQRTIRQCFELEIAECDRRLNRYDSAIVALNSFNPKDLDNSYWSGVVCELLGHFARQFTLSKLALTFYDKAIEIFDEDDSESNNIEKWHCHYSRNMLDNPQLMRGEDKPGGFLQGLYALTNSKYFANNGNIVVAVKYANESLSDFKSFASDIYQNRACILKLLLFLSSYEITEINDALKKMTDEELARARHDRIFSFIHSLDENNNSLIADYFSEGRITKAIALLAIKYKFRKNKDTGLNTKYRSLTVKNQYGTYKKVIEDIDYSMHIADGRLVSSILNYV